MGGADLYKENENTGNFTMFFEMKRVWRVEML